MQITVKLVSELLYFFATPTFDTLILIFFPDPVFRFSRHLSFSVSLSPDLPTHCLCPRIQCHMHEVNKEPSHSEYESECVPLNVNVWPGWRGVASRGCNKPDALVSRCMPLLNWRSKWAEGCGWGCGWVRAAGARVVVSDAGSVYAARDGRLGARRVETEEWGGKMLCSHNFFFFALPIFYDPRLQRSLLFGLRFRNDDGLACGGVRGW